jgi:hypothetical protein
MEKMKRTTKETAKIVESTISNINKVLRAVPIMNGYEWFDKKTFKKTGLDKLITNICKSNNISENHIRTVADWKKKEAQH